MSVHPMKPPLKSHHPDISTNSPKALTIVMASLTVTGILSVHSPMTPKTKGKLASNTSTAAVLTLVFPTGVHLRTSSSGCSGTTIIPPKNSGTVTLDTHGPGGTASATMS